MPRKKQELMPIKPLVLFTPERKARYLALLRETGYVTMSAEEVGVTARCVQDHVLRDKEFAEACRQAKDFHTENVLIRAATERAVKGISRPVIGGQFRDEIVTHEQVYSDSLLSQLLRSRRPEFNKGAEEGGGTGVGGGSAGGVLIVAQAPHSLEDWETLFGEKAKGTTGQKP